MMHKLRRLFLCFLVLIVKRLDNLYMTEFVKINSTVKYRRGQLVIQHYMHVPVRISDAMHGF